MNWSMSIDKRGEFRVAGSFLPAKGLAPPRLSNIERTTYSGQGDHAQTRAKPVQQSALRSDNQVLRCESDDLLLRTTVIPREPFYFP